LAVLYDGVLSAIGARLVMTEPEGATTRFAPTVAEKKYIAAHGNEGKKAWEDSRGQEKEGSDVAYLYWLCSACMDARKKKKERKRR